jgi:pilus assembly protein Flp/PilA
MLTYALLMVRNYLATLEQEEGQGMAEYGLILALVAVVVAVALTALAGNLSTLLTGITF